MLTAAITGLVALILFLGWGTLTSIEKRRGERLMLARARSRFDRLLTRLVMWLYHAVDFLTRRVITFTWYYSLQAFLRGVLKILERTYLYLERSMHFHRKKADAAQEDRREVRGMWFEMHEHKQATALSEAEKRKRKEASLRG